MFGLWYISLAIQEFRKYLGWTSVFDIFQTNKTDKNALQDNKPSEKPSTSTIKKPTDVPKVPEKKPDIKPAVPPQPKPSVELPKVPEKMPDVKPIVPEKPKSVPEPVKPKTPEIEKPQMKPVDVTPAPTLPAPTNGLPSSAANKQNNDFDKKLFGTTIENGGDNKDTSKTNVRDATTSFLEEEGRGGTLRQKRDVLAPR